MSRNGFQRVAATLATAATTLGLVACPGPSPKVQGSFDRPECPADFILVPREGSLTPVSSLPASGPISLVPEYHDCQKFTDSARTTYGSLVAVFASFRLDTVPDPGPGPYPTNTIVFDGVTRFASATILNYGEPYAPLRIPRDISCLYLYTANGVWKAHIRPARVADDCLLPFNTNAAIPPGSELGVIASAVPQGEKPPAVARWDWDATTGRHYLGIRCGSRWCEVFDPSTTLEPSARYSGAAHVAIKGWYDEQYLALKGPVSGPDLVPGSVLATIFPVGDLENNPIAAFVEWKQVALVSLSDESPEYKGKFNFVKGPAPLGNSEVWLCNGTTDDCHIPSTAPLNICENKNDKWWAKIVSGVATTYRCVIRRTHDNVDMPGAARWRWKVNDEGMWVRCPEGCCEVT